MKIEKFTKEDIPFSLYDTRGHHEKQEKSTTDEENVDRGRLPFSYNKFM